MLSYMMEEAGNLIIPNYDDKAVEASHDPFWEPNWFEEHIVPLAQNPPQNEERAVKRQKSEISKVESIANKVTQTQKWATGMTTTHVQDTQKSATESAKIAMLEQKIELLQTQQNDILV
jgi:hypothetical protein